MSKYIISFTLVVSFSVLLLAPTSASSAPLGENGICQLFPVSEAEACASGLICERTNDSAPNTGVCLKPGSTEAGFGLGTKSSFINVGLGQDKDLKGTIADLINIVLGFLGIIAVIIVMFGGFKWMTAAGNEDQVSQARQLIVGGIIGLVVIFAAWAIASFVVSSLQGATAT